MQVYGTPLESKAKGKVGKNVQKLSTLFKNPAQLIEYSKSPSFGAYPTIIRVVVKKWVLLERPQGMTHAISINSTDGLPEDLEKLLRKIAIGATAFAFGNSYKDSKEVVTVSCMEQKDLVLPPTRSIDGH